MMTVLSTKTRPQVMFDPANKDHRKWAAGFIKNQNWRECPVRFLVNDNSLDLSIVMQRQLVQYYTTKEFKL
jgi:hypothetical protein